MMERCTFCQGSIDPTTRHCTQCGRAQPTTATPGLAQALAEGHAATRRCPTCGDEVPSSARFCGRCGSAFSPPLEEREEQRSQGITLLPLAPGAAAGPGVPLAPAAAQSASPGIQAVSAGAQSAAPQVSGVAAGAQTGAPAVPSLAAGAQSATPTVPTTAAGAQTGAPAVPGAAAGVQTGTAASLLGTLTAKVVLVALVAVVVTGGAVGAIYLVPRLRSPASGGQSPQSGGGATAIMVTSQYHQGNTPAGATDTTIQISGQHFSANSVVNLLLDGQTAPGAPTAQTDAAGKFTATLTITADWRLGLHMLTARDASGKTAGSGIQVAIVPQGAAHTPGPHGAPPNDASFSLASMPDFGSPLQIAGRPDPAGGLACFARDDGQPHTTTDPTGAYVMVGTWTCTGLYKNGSLTVIEELTSVQFTGPGYSCTGANTPLVDVQLGGAFTNPTTISGMYHWFLVTDLKLNCTGGFPGSGGFPPIGPWTGMITTGQ